MIGAIGGSFPYCRSAHDEYARDGIPITFTTGGHADYHQVTTSPSRSGDAGSPSLLLTPLPAPRFPLPQDLAAPIRWG